LATFVNMMTGTLTSEKRYSIPWRDGCKLFMAVSRQRLEQCCSNICD